MTRFRSILISLSIALATVLGVAPASWAAFTEFYVRTGGSNLNSGSGNTDAADVSLTGKTWTQSTRTMLMADTTGLAVGDFVSIYPDGTTPDTPYVARITTVTANTSIVTSNTSLSGTAPTDGTTSRSLKKGGAWATVKFAFEFPAGAMVNTSSDPARVNFSAETHSQTTAVARSSAGPVTFYGASPTTTIISGGTSGASFILLTISGAGNSLRNMKILNNGGTGSATGVVLSGARGVINNVRVTGMKGLGIDLTEKWQISQIEVDANNSSNTASLGGIRFSNHCSGDRIFAHDNAGSNSSGAVIASTVQTTLTNSVFDRNGRNGILCGGAAGVSLINCDVVANAAAGMALSTGGYVLINSNFIANATHGITGAGSVIIERNCGFQGNVTAAVDATYIIYADVSGRVSYASNPYVDGETTGNPRGGNFTQTTASGGRGTGYGTVLQTSDNYDSTSTSYPDIGAVQHQESGGVSPLRSPLIRAPK